MAHVPLARKYRPTTFADLIGQPHVTQTLIRAIESGRIGQAYLFTGQRGVGKTSAARILAKSLNCVNGPTATPCQTCLSCQSIAQGNSLDVLEIDGASNRGIDDIRQLREQVKFSPVHGHFRVYIIDEVHQITTDAFNALLKTLEEPPAHAKFIFATTAPNKVPATILSRCQRFDFRRLTSQTVVGVLRGIAEAERVAVDDAALFAVARASEGSLRDAEVVLEQLISFSAATITEADVNQLLGGLEHDALLAWTQALLDRDAGAALTVLSQQLDLGKDLTQLLVALMTHVRNLLILRITEQAAGRAQLLRDLIDAPPDQITAMEEQAKSSTPEELLMIGQILATSYDWTRRSPFGQAVLEFALIKIAARESWASLDEIARRLEQIAHTQPAAPAALPPLRSPEPARSSAEPARSAAAPPGPSSPSRPISRPAALSTPPAASSPRAVSSSSGPATAAISTAVMDQPAPAVTMQSPQEFLNRWADVLQRVSRQKMSLASYLTEARPLGVAGDVLQIGLPEIALHQEVLNHLDNVRLVERVISELFGRACRIQYTTMPPGDGVATDSSASAPMPTSLALSEAPMPPLVQDIVNLFDATLVRQPQPPPLTPL